jgi:hypothetical protein
LVVIIQQGRELISPINRLRLFWRRPLLVLTALAVVGSLALAVLGVLTLSSANNEFPDATKSICTGGATPPPSGAAEK